MIKQPRIVSTRASHVLKMSRRWKLPKNASPYIKAIAEGGNIPEGAEREIIRDWLINEDLQKHGEFSITALLDENGDKTNFGVCSKCVALPILEYPRVIQIASGRDRVKKTLIQSHVQRYHVRKFTFYFQNLLLKSTFYFLKFTFYFSKSTF